MSVGTRDTPTTIILLGVLMEEEEQEEEGAVNGRVRDTEEEMIVVSPFPRLQTVVSLAPIIDVGDLHVKWMDVKQQRKLKSVQVKI